MIAGTQVGTTPGLTRVIDGPSSGIFLGVNISKIRHEVDDCWVLCTDTFLGGVELRVKDVPLSDIAFRGIVGEVGLELKPRLVELVINIE